eukprot:Mycagemm_TRINITY_DN10295_c2_g2::TRINITY_DN10295_c2_g2_i1::g.4088::m.4088 type:complete len:108 gc:universal TRINITY_DN10295_c2_g2_i1:791-468(-)
MWTPVSFVKRAQISRIFMVQSLVDAGSRRIDHHWTSCSGEILATDFARLPCSASWPRRRSERSFSSVMNAKKPSSWSSLTPARPTWSDHRRLYFLALVSPTRVTAAQ